MRPQTDRTIFFLAGAPSLGFLVTLAKRERLKRRSASSGPLNPMPNSLCRQRATIRLGDPVLLFSPGNVLYVARTGDEFLGLGFTPEVEIK